MYVPLWANIVKAPVGAYLVDCGMYHGTVPPLGQIQISEKN